MPGVSTVTNRVEFQGDGSSAVLSFAFPIHRSSDLGVFAYNSSATTPNTIVPMTLNGGGGTGYTVQGNADQSGVYPNGVNVFLNSAPNIDTVIVMFRSSVLTNDFAIGQSGNIPSAGLNNELNYLTLIAQRHQDQITRSLRLADGVPGFFNMALPDNIKSRPLQFLATNSNANGFILTDPNGGQYIENTVIIATNSSSLASLGGSASGLLLQSNGSSAPTWAAIAFGSGPVPSGAITGILSVAQGGTGTGSGYNQFGLIFACSAIDFTSTAAGGTDIPLLGNNGAGPSFRPLPITSGSSVTGTLPVAFGGTGNAAPLLPLALLYGQAPGAVGFITTGSPGQVLTANSGLVATFQTLPTTDFTVGTGVLQVANGGTGQSLPLSAQGVLFASSVSQVAVVPNGILGQALLSNGPGAAPSFQSIAAGGGGTKDYLKTVNGVNGNGDFELGNTVKWAPFTTVINSTIPVGTLTFGSSNFSQFAALNSGPLAGNYSLNVSIGTSWLQGQGFISDAVTLDLEDRAKVMTFKAYYQVGSGVVNFSGTNSNSFAVYFLDVTNSSATGGWIQPAGVYGMTQTNGVGYVTGTFQTSFDGQQYRMAFLNPGAPRGPLTGFRFDDIGFGPQTAPVGPSETDWREFIPTGSWNTNTAYTGRFKRVGDTALFDISVRTGGAPNSSALTVNLPAGMSLDYSKLTNSSAAVGSFLSSGVAVDSGSRQALVTVFANDATSVFPIAEGATGGAGITNNAPFAWGAGDVLSFQFQAPIAGLSSNVQMSNDTDTRVVFAKATGDPAQNTANNPIVWPTTEIDTHGAYNPTTGVYTVPVSGQYKVFGFGVGSAALATYYLGVNGAYGSSSVMGNMQTNGVVQFLGAANVKAGDTLSVLPSLAQNLNAIGNVNFERISGPSVIAATESVNMKWAIGSGTISTAFNTISWTSRSFDSHGGMNANGIYTVPVSGRYNVFSSLTLSGTWAVGNFSAIEIQKNNLTASNITTLSGGSVSVEVVRIDDIIECLAGDQLKILVSTNGTSPVINVTSSVFRNYFFASRIGN